MIYGFSAGVWHQEPFHEIIESLTQDQTCEVLEISALHLDELAPLLLWLETWERPEHLKHVSMHGPAKGLVSGWPNLLLHTPATIDHIVIHPDVVKSEEWIILEALGPRLVIENMDNRKENFGNVKQLEALLHHLPQAGFCLDIAHAYSRDPSGKLALALMGMAWDRLVQMHISGVKNGLCHQELGIDDLKRYSELLNMASNIPLVFESHVSDAARKQLASAR